MKKNNNPKLCILNNTFDSLTEGISLSASSQQNPTPVFDAFVKYGFKREAQTLHLDGKPAIGHYISFLESIPKKSKSKVEGVGSYERIDERTDLKAEYFIARNAVLKYVELLASENIEGAVALKTDLEGILQ